MEISFDGRAQQVRRQLRSTPIVAMGATLALLAVATTALSGRGPQTSASATTTGGLRPEQIVIRGEVADRLAASPPRGGLRPEELVIRGEVADRLATATVP